MEDARPWLFPEVIRGPAEDLAVVFPVRGSVVAEGHAALRTRDLELRVGAVEQPPVS